MSSSLTFDTWARRISDASAIPAPFVKSFEAQNLGALGFPLVLFSPVFKFDRYENTPKLLVAAGERLVCLDDRGAGVKVTELKLSDVHMAEWGRELLNAWLGFEANGASGARSIRVDFNAASRDVYVPLLTELRRSTYADCQADYGRELAKFEVLKSTQFKLMNFARQCLIEGAEVKQFHLQPAVKALVPGGTDKIEIRGSLAILTQKELILIREGDDKEFSYYTGVWRYLRLDRIVQVDVTPIAERELVELRISLPGGGKTTRVCVREREPELQVFAEAVRQASLNQCP